MIFKTSQIYHSINFFVKKIILFDKIKNIKIMKKNIYTIFTKRINKNFNE